MWNEKLWLPVVDRRFLVSGEAMVVSSLRPCKRLKRRVTADLFDLRGFPPHGFADLYASRPFRWSVRSFLSRFARLPPAPLSLLPSPHLQVSEIAFRIAVGDVSGDSDSRSSTVTLNIVEEDVSRSRAIYCDHCRIVGWSSHPVCNTRYHFIIRADYGSLAGYPETCTKCGASLTSLDSRYKSCHYQMTSGDLEDWVYLQLENPNHLLHGIVHSNGYGHLLRVNGREGGSKILSGCEIMDFWDRLCIMLRIRKVSVMDVSKKYGLEYRLLNSVAKGRQWYGNWGYEFGTGSFAITNDSYMQAVHTLSSVPLQPFLSEERSCWTPLHGIISLYYSLSVTPLVTLQDLVQYIMRLVHDVHRGQSTKPKPEGTELSRWTADDVNQTEGALLKVLQVMSGSSWVSYKSLKGAVSQARNLEILEFCLKHIAGKFVGDRVVCSQFDPTTNALQYRLERMQNTGETANLRRTVPSVENLLSDLRTVYHALLHPQTMVNFTPLKTRDLAVESARKLLDCKQFVKNYEANLYHKHCNTFTVTLLCKVELIDQTDGSVSPPPELITLPLSATVADLKLEITKAFRDVYVFFRHFQVEDLADLSHVEDSAQLSLLADSKKMIVARGRCPSGGSLVRFLMERGTENWVVDCQCGAQDDDGERMLACDVCGLWQHTRCVGISDFDAVPTKFLCTMCMKSKNHDGCKDIAGPNINPQRLSTFGVR